jgi:hypothetical protein
MRHLFLAVPACILILAAPIWAQDTPVIDTKTWPALVDTHIQDLNQAFAADPQADQARVPYQKTLLHLQDLREHLMVKGYATTTASAWITAANRTWQLNVSPVDGTETIFEPDSTVLAPVGSPTILAIRKIRDSVASQITVPVALDTFRTRVSRSSDQWGRFYQGVVLQEYPWESFLNARLDWRRSALDAPPNRQWRLLHPVSALVAYQGRSTTGTASTAILAMEALGLQWYAEDDQRAYKATYGLSALFTLKGPGDASNGYGLMGTYRDFKVGVKWAKLPDGRATSQVILSLNLVRYLQLKGDQGLVTAIANMGQ